MTIITNNNTVYTTKNIKFYVTFLEFLHDNKVVNLFVKDLKEIT